MALPTAEAQPAAPSTFTFLFTDIEGSTRLLRDLGDRFADCLRTHHRILEESVTAHGGTVQRTEGDAFFATFTAVSSAVAAAVEAQRRLRDGPWPDGAPLLVRMGIHTGEALVQDGEVIGIDVHRAARIAGAAWGGQILVSDASSALLRGVDVDLRDLGEHHLKDLPVPERLHQVVVPDLRVEFPALRSLDVIPTNLPPEVTAFVGREHEVETVAGLLGTSRVLTLTGPGGTGKTRLSLRVARATLDRFPDGVFFAALAPVSEPPLVMTTIASAIGLTNVSGRAPLDVVAEHLAQQRVLLVLDNFEQVLDAAPDVSELVAAAPDVQVLVTSRAPLRIAGEREFPVPPLTLPSDADLPDLDDLRRSEAVQLFAMRAAAVDPSFELRDEDVAAVAEIVVRLDGLPLAIELAAARVKLLPPRDIATRLGRGLDLLASSARDVTDRQRTLRGAIAWSDDLLPESSSRFFHRFSVFAGGASLEDIEVVCGEGLAVEPFDTVAELVDHSLLRRVPDADLPRFTMLETIREYAAEQLAAAGDAAETRRRHLERFLALAVDAAPHLTGADRVEWLDRLDLDLDNLRKALSWAVSSGDVRSALVLVASLWRHWQARGLLHEGLRYAQEVLTLAGTDAFPRELAGAHEAAGGLVYWMGDLEGARPHYLRALELYREIGDDACVARSTYNLAFTYLEGDEEQITRFEEALDAFGRLGDRLGVARSHWGLAVASFWHEDYQATCEHASVCVPVFREANELFDLAWALHMLGFGQLGIGDLDSARNNFSEALELFRAANDVTGVHLALFDFAVLAARSDDRERAVRLLAVVDELSEQTGGGLVNRQPSMLGLRDQAVEGIDAATLERLREEGRRLDVEAAIAYALGGPFPEPGSAGA